MVGVRGVSVMVGIITLIGMAVLLASSLSLALRSWEIKGPLQALLELKMEKDKYGRENLVLRHLGGDPFPEAFSLSNGAISWNNLEVRVNGVRVEVEGEALFNGQSSTQGKVKFSRGDELSFPLSGLREGDSLSVIYRPGGQMLLEIKVS